MCCSVLQCAAECSGVFQCVPVCCCDRAFLQKKPGNLWREFDDVDTKNVFSISRCPECCSVLKCGAVWCSVLQCVAVCSRLVGAVKYVLDE